jgi:hypothetical protein
VQAASPKGHLSAALRAEFGAPMTISRLASQREALARQFGADGYHLLEWVRSADTALVWRELPTLEALLW